MLFLQVSLREPESGARLLSLEALLRASGIPIILLILYIANRKHVAVFQGDSVYKWRTQPFKMFKGGSTWIPPPISPYTAGMPEDLVDEDAPASSRRSESNDNVSTSERRPRRRRSRSRSRSRSPPEAHHSNSSQSRRGGQLSDRCCSPAAGIQDRMISV